MFAALTSLLVLAQAAPPAEPAPAPPAPVAIPAPAKTFFSAQALRAQCELADAQAVTACFAFVGAVYDTSRAYQQWMNFREFCIPADVTKGELRLAMLQYLNLHPRESDAQAASVVVLALKDRYACPVSVTPPAQPTPQSATPPVIRR